MEGSDLFRFVDDLAPGPLVQGTPPVAGLFVTGFFAWWLRPVPPSEALSWSGVATEAALHVLLVLVIAVATLLGVQRIVLENRPHNRRRTLLYTGACAVWLAPLTVLLSEASLFVVFPAAFLALGLVKILQTFSDPMGQTLTPQPIGATPWALSNTPNLRLTEEWRVRSLTASVLLQAALVACLTRSPVGAAGFTVAGAAVLVWNSTRERDVLSTRKSDKTAVRIVSMTALAVVFTAAGLVRYLASDMWPSGIAGGQDLAGAVRSLFAPVPFGHEVGTSPEDAEQGNRVSRSQNDLESKLKLSRESYPGVILLPEEQSFVKVLTVPPVLRASIPLGIRTDPLAIPFEGVNLNPLVLVLHVA